MHFDLTASRIWLLFYDFYAVLIRWEALISTWIPKGAALIRRRRLFEARGLLEEIRYSTVLHSFNSFVFIDTA